MKQAIVARADLGMGRGELIAQVAHASLSVYESIDSQTRKRWEDDGQKKVILRASGESELSRLANEVERTGTPHAIIHDAERTQLGPSTVTALVVGSAEGDETDRVTDDFSLY